ncbi:MAG: glycerophosphodiester phosphodiesterase [Acidimicrobiales bacterium]
MTLVIAHRGASAAHPENTIEAFTAALEMGADWVELDVRPAADGTPVVHHDPMLADGRAIAELSPTRLPDHVPTLEAAIDACGPMGINIEIKSDPAEEFWDPEHHVVDASIAFARRLLGAERTLITSFDMGAINRAHDVDDRIPTGFLTEDPVGVEVSVGRTVAHNHAAVNPSDALVTPRWVAHAKEAGLQVYVWTIDDPKRMVEVAKMGVDGIITNKPDVARKALG